ncbi:VanZ family protein [Virgibacillus dakarensis]|nr:VanZ family protein [Virgibacillus dakarensis]
MAGFLFTSDINALLSHGALDIHMTSHPDFVFFEIYELSPNLLIQKVGHLLMFAMWLLSIFLGIKRLKTAVWITLGLAVVSELIQPYFSRDGHLLDVAFDSIGILLMAFFIHIFLSATSDIR